MFKNIGEHEKKLIIEAFDERRYPDRAEVISEGQEGDEMFIVECGELHGFRYQDFSIRLNNVVVYKSGDAFGEFSLMHNVKNDRTVVATVDSVL